MRRVSLLIVLALLMLSLPVFAQKTEEDVTEAQEYEEDEFPLLLRELRRGEIIMLGSFPLTLFLTLEAFDIYRYIKYRGTSESYHYAFWPYRSPDPAPYSAGEITGIIATALSASLMIAVADYIIGKVKDKRSED